MGKKISPQSSSGEAKYKAILEAIPNLFFLCDQKNVFLDYHLPDGEKLYAPPDHFLGKKIHDVLPYELANNVEHAFQKCLSTGKKQEIEYELEINGIIYNYEAVITLTENDNLLTCATDITERRRVEDEIKIQNEKLLKLNAEKDTFLSIIAHDLKSPFQGFLNITELMAKDTEEFSAAEWVQNSKLLNRAAHNVYNLLDNLLEWAKVQRGLIDYSPKDLDLLTLVSESIDSISDRALQKRIAIINEIDNAHKIFADKKMISTVLRNLLSNAVKFTRPGGKVIIKSERSGNGKIDIAVADSGIGISDKNIEKLFKIEEKVGTLGTEGELSTGLGLLLCKEFVEKHGEIIWVESKENEGSIFSFSLPEGG